MNPNDILVSQFFDLDSKLVKIVDITDYATESPNATAYVSTGSLIGPGPQTVFSVLNPLTPLIALDTPATDSAFYNLPLTNTGGVAPGQYVLNYSVYLTYNSTTPIIVISAGPPDQIFLTGDFSFIPVGTQVTLSNMTDPTLDGTYTVATLVYDPIGGTTEVTFVEAFSGAGETGDFGWDFAEVVSKTVSVNLSPVTKVNPCVTFSFDCANGSVTVSDVTDMKGQSVASRVLSLKYPDGLVDPIPLVDPFVSSNQSFTLNELANGTYTVTLDLGVTYTQPDGLVVVYTVRKVEEKAVSCAIDLCCIDGCLDKLYGKYATCSGPNMAYDGLVTQVNFLITRFNLAKSCGDINSAAKILEEIKKLLKTECSCCGDGKSDVSWVNPNGGSSVGWVNNSFSNQVGSTCPVIFASPLPFGEVIPGFIVPGTVERTRPITDLFNIPISPQLFQFAPQILNLYGDKVLMIEFDFMTTVLPLGFTQLKIELNDYPIIVPITIGDNNYGRVKVLVGTVKDNNATRAYTQYSYEFFDEGTPPTIHVPTDYQLGSFELTPNPISSTTTNSLKITALDPDVLTVLNVVIQIIKNTLS